MFAAGLLPSLAAALIGLAGCGGLPTTSDQMVPVVDADGRSVPGRVTPDSVKAQVMSGEGADFAGPGQWFVADDGHSVSFVLDGRGDSRSLGFDVNALRYGPPSAERVPPPTGGVPPANWCEKEFPTLARDSLHLRDGEVCTAGAIAPDGGGFVLGTDRSLRAFDSAGRERWVSQAPKVVRAVNRTADGTLILAAFGDGTIRWFRESDGQPVLSLFVHRDGVRWLAWTPGGFFAGSPGAESLVGFQVDRGPDRDVLKVNASQVYSQFYRPDLVAGAIEQDRRHLERLKRMPREPGDDERRQDPQTTQLERMVQQGLVDEEYRKYIAARSNPAVTAYTKAEWAPAGPQESAEDMLRRYIRQGRVIEGMDLELARERLDEMWREGEIIEDYKYFDQMRALAKVLAQGEPPRVRILGPQQRSVSGPEFDLEVEATDQGGGIGELQLVVNGKPVPVDGARAPGLTPDPRGPSGSRTLVWQVPVSGVPGDNVVEASVTNSVGVRDGAGASATVRVPNTGALPVSLYLLAVGIDNYSDPSYKPLTLSGNDALGLEAILKSQGSGVFGDRIYTRVLTTREETTLEALQHAVDGMKAKPQDVFVLYLAGHADALDSRYGFITSDSKRLGHDKIRDLFKSVNAGYRVLVLDNCFAGAEADDPGTRGAITALSNENQVSILAANRANQCATQGYRGHGVYTYFLIKGLSGAADQCGGSPDGQVTLDELSFYLEKQVSPVARQCLHHEQQPTRLLIREEFPLTRAARTDESRTSTAECEVEKRCD